MHQSCNSITLSTAAVGIAVLVVAGIAGKDWVLEEWALYKLRFGTLRAQEIAADKLGRLKSLKAVPHLLALLKRGQGMSKAGDDGDTTHMFCMHTIEMIGRPALPKVINAYRIRSDGADPAGAAVRDSKAMVEGASAGNQAAAEAAATQIRERADR